MIENILPLLNKYDIPLPRYTSYPPVPHWRQMPTQESWIKSVKEHLELAPASIYIHIPFCKKLCSFCACNKIITLNTEAIDQYVETLIKEIELYHKHCGKIKAVNLHLGGGTPTYLTSQNIVRLFDRLSSYISFEKDAEISVEADPRTTTREKLETFAKAGFNRISFGVQDFDQKVQETINRVQSFEMVECVTKMARDSGFDDINFDLIYGLPFQTQETITQTFEKVCLLKPNRIAFYSYAHLPTNFAAQMHVNKFEIPSGSYKQQLNFAGRQVLLQNGYSEIGMDHFALKDDSLLIAAQSGALTRNFMGYTQKFSNVTVAFGYSAISDTKDFFVQNTKDILEYESMVNDGQIPIAKGHIISENEKILRKKIIELMTKFSTSLDDYIDAANYKIKELIKDGLVEVSQSSLTVTTNGISFLRPVAASIDPATQFPF